VSGQPLSLGALRAAGYLSEGDVQLGRLCAREDGEDSRALSALLFATASRFLSLGHSCLPLAVLAEEQPRAADGSVVGAFPPVSELKRAILFSPAVTVVGPEDAGGTLTTPFVLDDKDRLFIARYFDHERALAFGLTSFLSAPLEMVSGFDLEARLDHYFPREGASGEENKQRSAAQLALRRPFCIITGGPGTGKTSTVVKILALLSEEARTAGRPAPIVRLLAPTGKAAARVLEAVQSAVARLDLSPEVRKDLVKSASTIHRALGVLFDNPTRFRKGPRERLRADVVIVDEASMVDLALMRHLVAALEEGARLILLGDRFQLASVEAGSVLFELSSALGGAEPVRSEASGFPAVTSCMVELDKSYRFSKNSGIDALSSAFREGDGAGALSVLRRNSADLAWIEPEPRVDGYGPEPEYSAPLRRLLTDSFSRAMSHDEPEKVYVALGQFRVLCAHRRGAFGVERLNEAIERWLRKAGKIPSSGEFYRGRPVLITQNDYGVGLHNGDVGLCWRKSDGKVHVIFPKEGGAFRSLSPAQLPAHETAFALTVHKSQGSEHEEVVLVLPEAGSQLLSRELIYTGITRAKKMMTLYASSMALTEAAERQVSRYTGLSDSLQAAMRAERPNFR
jgi:exodeoxyribonuclease V alpha subunit